MYEQKNSKKPMAMNPTAISALSNVFNGVAAWWKIGLT